MEISNNIKMTAFYLITLKYPLAQKIMIPLFFFFFKLIRSNKPA
jgi:hypothetical protein